MPADTPAPADSKGKEKADQPPPPASAGSQRANLLWARRTVYIHPSPFRKDNVPGYLAIATEHGPVHPQSSILLAFLPESLLRATDDDAEGKFISVETRLASSDFVDLAAGAVGTSLEDSRETLDGVELDDKESLLISSPPPSAQYAFSIPIHRLHSFTVQPPTVSSWYGNITFTLTDGLSLPTLFFHDDESQSIQAGLERALRFPSGSLAGSDRASSASGGSSGNASSARRVVSAGAAPSSSGSNSAATGAGAGAGAGSGLRRSSPPHSPAATWGGEELIRQLRRFANILRSVTQPGLFLVNPNRQQIEAHATPIFDDDIFAPSTNLSSSFQGSLHHHQSHGSATAPDDANGSSFPDDPFSNPSHIYRHSTLLQSLPNSSAFSLHSQQSQQQQHQADSARLDPLTHWATSTRTSLLSRFSHITQQARHATHVVLSHPLARPYVPHLPLPVQSFAQADLIPLGPREKEWGRIAGKAGLLNPEGDAEYDSARVYLAKWARLVAEEGERNRKREQMSLSLKNVGGKGSAAAVGPGKGGAEGEASVLSGGLYELLGRPGTNLPKRPETTRVSDPPNPIGVEEWAAFFDESGKLRLSSAEVKRTIFARGIADTLLPLESASDASQSQRTLRAEVWPFLLGAVPWTSTRAEREALWAARVMHFEALRRVWKEREVLGREEEDGVGVGGERKRRREEGRRSREERAREREERLKVRTERALMKEGNGDALSASTPTSTSTILSPGEEEEAAADAAQAVRDAELERAARLEELEMEQLSEQRHRIRVDCLRTDRNHVMFKDAELAPEDSSSSSHSSDGSDSDAESRRRRKKKKKAENPNVGTLGEILLTYGIWEQGVLGSYVQGMSDLCSPIFVVCGGEEVRTFWCFVGLMQRMFSNFLSDQSGMKRQLLLLQQLISTMDAPLFEHFERIDALNLFFCFRWLLVLFKREFGFADVLRLWECVWAAEFDDAGPEVGVGVGVVEGGGGGEEGKTPMVDGDGGGTGVGSTDGSGPVPSPAAASASAPGGLSNHFQLFVALGILEMNRDMLLRYLENFDEMLQYMNELSQQMDVEQVIVQAESLCLALQSLVTPAPPSSDSASGPTVASASKNGKGSGSGPGAELAIPVISADLVGLVTSRRRV